MFNTLAKITCSKLFLAVKVAGVIFWSISLTDFFPNANTLNSNCKIMQIIKANEGK